MVFLQNIFSECSTVLPVMIQMCHDFTSKTSNLCACVATRWNIKLPNTQKARRKELYRDGLGERVGGCKGAQVKITPFPLTAEWKWKCPSLSCVWLFATPWTVACQLLCPWNSPVKNRGVGYHFLLRGSSWLRDWSQVSRVAGKFFTIWATCQHRDPH